jgi:hypothetical protein
VAVHKRQIVFTHFPGLAHDNAERARVDDFAWVITVKVDLQQISGLSRIIPRCEAFPGYPNSASGETHPLPLGGGGP